MKKVMVLFLFTLVVSLSFQNALADEASEEITFMGMRFGHTTLSEAQKEVKRQGFTVSDTYMHRGAFLFTPISCYYHPDDLAAAGFPWNRVAIHGASRYIDIYYGEVQASKAYSVGGIKVSEIELYFCGYNYSNGKISEIKDEGKYWFFAGEYTFEYIGSASKKDSQKTYNTLLNKLKNLYGEPLIVESTSVVGPDGKKQTKPAFHAIWIGANETGIFLDYQPSMRANITSGKTTYEDRYVVTINYGKTGMYDFIAKVNEYENAKATREGL